MKKLVIFTLIACLLLSFAGCQSGTTEEKKPGGYQDANNFAFTYKGTEIKLAAPAEPVIAALGEPMKYTESASCAFDGLDKQYYYGSFYLETYPDGDKDFIYGWWFADDSISTPEGIYIGADQASVEKAYGAENFNGTNSFAVKQGNGTLTILLEKGVVSSIQYNLNVE